MKHKSISVFFPAYGDEGSIAFMVEKALRLLPTLTDDYEVIVIDDASPDRSGEIADELAKKYKQVRVIHHKKNRGYGGALKSGFKNATKDLIFYTDGDGQYDVNELTKLIPLIGSHDVVNGYKIKRSDSIYRTVLGKLYHLFINFIFNLNVRDVDCDFRLIKREVFDNIDLESEGGSICLEMMKKIQDKGHKIAEVPVHHYPRISGSSQFFKVNRLIRTFRGVAKQWVNLVLFKKHKRKNEFRR